MSRKPLLLSLIVLVALAVAWVVLSSQKPPSPSTRALPPSPPPQTSVRQSESTLTRVLSPRDLEIVESTPTLNAEREGVMARHKVVIRNNGKVSYKNISLELSYFDKTARIVATRTYVISALLRVGETATLPAIEMPNLPQNITSSKTIVLHADLVPQ